MAPALNEPLSQTLELSKTNPTTNTRSTRRTHDTKEDKLSSKQTTTQTTVETSTTAINTPTTTTTTTRLTRSRGGNNNRVSELAVTAHSNQSMGISTANDLNSNNSNKSDNSTQQILADLESNFEGAITAEICLRKQLLDANLNKEAASVANSTDLKDILVIKSAASGAVESMDSLYEDKLSSATTPTPTLSTSTPSQLTTINDDKRIENAAETETEPEPEKNKFNDMEFLEKEIKAVAQTNLIEKPKVITRPIILSVEELPPISTDSTMSASEVEDNLEERLSQLDGGGNVATTNEDSLTTSSIVNTSHHQVFQDLQLSTKEQQQLTQISTNTTLSNISSASGSSGIGGVNGSGNNGNTNPEIEDHDLEEVLKVLKGLDNNATGSDALCDLNALFGEVITTINLEENAAAATAVPVAPTTTTTTIINNPSIQIVNPSTSPIKISTVQETQAQTEIKKTQELLERKTECLLRRLRKFQARYMCKHVSEEIAGVFEHVVRATKHKTHESDIDLPVISARPPPNIWEEEREQPVSTAQMSELLNKLEIAANKQQLSTSTKNYFNSGISSNMVNNRKSKKALNAEKGLIANTPAKNSYRNQ